MTTWPTMPFGRHKGQDVRDVPTDYLQWVLQNIPRERLSTPLRAAIIVVVTDRLRPSEGDKDEELTGPERCRMAAEAEALARTWLDTMQRRWAWNRQVSRMNLGAALSDGFEQLQQMLLGLVGPERPE
jgi:hypothetical protein